MENTSKSSMADTSVTLQPRKVNNPFLSQVDLLIDWKPVIKLIKKHYKKKFNVAGRPAYSGLRLFKICLLQTWYGLSDYKVEDRINDSLSFSQFLGMSFEECSPDHSTISRFRTLMTKRKVYETLLSEIRNQLEQHNLSVKCGELVDAKIVNTTRGFLKKPNYEIVENRPESLQTDENQAQ